MSVVRIVIGVIIADVTKACVLFKLFYSSFPLLQGGKGGGVWGRGEEEGLGLLFPRVR